MSRPKEILLVEDNGDDVDLTLLALRRANIGNPVTIARDGEEALDILLRRGAHAARLSTTRPALILLDLKLPKLDGLEVLAEIRKHAEYAPVPVVVLTSSKEDADLARAYKLGANSYLHKPVDFERFLEVTGNVGMYWLLLNETPRDDFNVI